MRSWAAGVYLHSTYLIGAERAWARARARARPRRFFELFGVFELEVLESSLGPSWPELEKAKPELEKAKSEPARAIFLE